MLTAVLTATDECCLDKLGQNCMRQTACAEFIIPDLMVLISGHCRKS